ncbi:MAG: DUF2281 domain-containing protein [Cyanothece sp. SIO2G6]|nr:DUF2281 domain-containing protein [Cyanothece sp. SIO2G6]
MTTVEVRDRITQTLATLSPEQLNTVLDFVEFLQAKQLQSPPPPPLGQEMRDLFQITQALPGVKNITKAEIQAEIEAYRNEEQEQNNAPVSSVG